MMRRNRYRFTSADCRRGGLASRRSPLGHQLTQDEKMRGGRTRGNMYVRAMHLAIHGYDPMPDGPALKGV